MSTNRKKQQDISAQESCAATRGKSILEETSAAISPAAGSFELPTASLGGHFCPYSLPGVLASPTEAAMREHAGLAEHDLEQAICERMDNLMQEYEGLAKRVLAAAIAAFPLEYSAGRLDDALVGQALDASIAQFAGLICPPRLDLDPFSDVVWPTTKLYLAAQLGIPVSIDASRLEAWHRLHRTAF